MQHGVNIPMVLTLYCIDLSSKIERVPCVGGRITLGLHTVLLADLYVVSGNGIINVIGRFDKGSHKASSNVPFDVTVDKPNA